MTPPPSVYAWLRTHGCWLTRDDPRQATHLLLDGGRAAVADDVHGTFLNAYATGVVRDGAAAACMVELRTPVFRLFLDVDARWDERPPDDVTRAPGIAQLLAAAVRVAGEAFEGADPGAVVCAASEATRSADGWKRGLHVVWPDVYVAAHTALQFREALLAQLRDAQEGDGSPFADDWESIVDACVYRANGLRMLWSGKGRGSRQHYAPVAEVAAGGEVTAVDAIEGVSAVRDYVRRLSLRCHAADPTPTCLVESPQPADDSGSGSGSMTGGSLAPFAAALPALGDALPAQYAGQRFVGLVRGEACFMLRSTSRWCGNLDAEHRSSNVYFVLTRRGISQRCYCRKDTTERRKYGLCKDYCSDTWPVAAETVAAFFDDPSPPPPATAPAPRAANPTQLPSQASRSALDLQSLLERRVEPARKPAGKRRRKQ